MKTNVFKMMAIIATLVFCGLPQNAVSQNKVKKVKYYGHTYEGQVNKDKVPEGEGTITIGGLVINGLFNGATVTNAEVKRTEKSSLDTSYSGTVLYGESDNITLKAGGKMAALYYERFIDPSCKKNSKF